MPQTEIYTLLKRLGSSKQLLWVLLCILFIFIVYFVYRRYKLNKSILFEHYTDTRLSIDLWIQSSPNVQIDVYYANKLLGYSSMQNGRVYQYTIPNVVSGHRVYIHCKKSQNIVSTQGTYIIGKYRYGSKTYYSDKSTFKFEGIKTENGVITKDKYMGCFPAKSDGRVALTNITSNEKLTRAQCRSLAIKQNYQYYALTNGGTCAIANAEYDKYGGDTNVSNCQMPCEKNISERCGGDNYNSVYSVKELEPDILELEPLGGGLIDSSLEFAKRVWMVGGDEVEGTWVASFAIPDLMRQFFCPDPDYVEFNPAGCINANNVYNCENSHLANYTSKHNLCLTRFDWKDADNFTITSHKVFDYLTRLSAKKIFVRFNADKSIYSYSSISSDPGSDDPTIDGNSSWTPLFGDVSQKTAWIKINAGRPIDIGGIILYGNGMNSNFVKTLIISYSRDEIKWTVLEEMNGNENTSSAKYIFFETIAQYIKIEPRTFSGSNVSLRFDLLIPNKTSNMGMEGGTSSTDITTNVPISMKSLTNINTLDGVVKAANLAPRLGESPEYTTSHKYVSKFVFANYKLVVLLKVIAEKIDYPVDIDQMTADGIVIPDTPMYYNLIRKGIHYAKTDAIKLQFDRYFKDVFLYARLITETPMMVRTCDCIEDSIDDNQKCAPC